MRSSRGGCAACSGHRASRLCLRVLLIAGVERRACRAATIPPKRLAVRPSQSLGMFDPVQSARLTAGGELADRKFGGAGSARGSLYSSRSLGRVRSLRRIALMSTRPRRIRNLYTSRAYQIARGLVPRSAPNPERDEYDRALESCTREREFLERRTRGEGLGVLQSVE